MSDWNTKVIEEFRANDGEVGGPLAHLSLLLLHHTGAKSGTERVNPLAYLKDGDRYVIFASKAGAPDHPAWYHNLRANPETTIEIGTETLPVLATEAGGEERDRLYAAMVAATPQFAEYQQQTERRIPVVVLTPA